MFTRVFLVSGWPGNGKSTLCSLYKNFVINSQVFSLDDVFMDPIYPDFNKRDISRHLRDGNLDKKCFMTILEKRFLQWNNQREGTSIQDVFVEGFVLYYAGQEIKEFFRQLKVDAIINIEMKGFGFSYKNRNLSLYIESRDSRDCDFSKVVKVMQDEDYKEIRNKINYQRFDDLEPMEYSTSRVKWNLSGVLTLTDSAYLSFLDVGCNNGYMSFRAAEKFNKVIGIDSNEGALSVAQYLNNYIYKNSRINFRSIDFYDESFHPKIDIIFCSSFLHYSVGESKIIEFFEKCYILLNKNGVLVIEIELYPHMETPHLEVSSRPAGGIMSYPNIPWIFAHTRDRFCVSYFAQSLFQPGGNFQRYFFHFRKI